MEAADLRPLGNREAAGKAKVDLRPLGNREAGKDRPAKVGKTMSMEGKRNAALEFIVRTSKTFSLVASGGRTDGYKVIAHGDGVDVVFVGKMLEHRNCVWIAGDGFESEVKLEDGKTVAYTPCITKFTNKELEEMSFKQLVCKLAMDPLDILCCALAKAGIPFEEDQLAFKHMMENDDEEEDDEDEEDDDDDVEDTGDLGDLGNSDTTTVLSEQGTTA